MTKISTFAISAGVKPTEDSYEVGTQFSKETHIRDEDDELRKFIDTEITNTSVTINCHITKRS